MVLDGSVSHTPLKEFHLLLPTYLLVPTVTYNLIVETDKEVKVNKTTFDAIGIGDSVVVSEYSDGSYRLEAYALIRNKSYR